MVIVGGGIVGTATAREFVNRHRHLKIAIVEKESSLAVHQSGHNSGVIHAGIYYTPGSLKAQLCVKGMRLMYDFCDARNIPYKKVGKLIVATTPIEVQRLDNLEERGIKNQVPGLKRLKTNKEIREIEPNCGGLEALWSPETGIVDYRQVTIAYGEDFKTVGGKIFLGFKVNAFKDSGNTNYPVEIFSKSGEKLKSKYVLTCGGLYSDVLAEMSGCSRSPRILPFRGEYLILNPEKRNIIKGNIYPVPDPRFPFLGVHFTPRLDGNVWLGPNAVLAYAREGYKMWDINLKELFDAITYPGFIKLASKFVTFGLGEMYRSIVISAQVKQLQRFIPDLKRSDVKRGPAGVRAQALDIHGNLVDDFYFDLSDSKNQAMGKRVIHCRNAPSPGATSSQAIAIMICDKLEKEFDFKN